MIYTSREVYEYISSQTNDPIVERKTCAISWTQFPIYQSDLDFYTKISPTFAGEKFQIPTPTLCPEERQRRRLSFRNERKLYKRTCNYSGKEIISIYSPDKPYKVYDQKIRWSDARDPMDYGRDFDFMKSFTEQFHELMREVPRWWIINTDTIENSPYTNFTDSSSNIYMCSDVYQSNDVYYSQTIKNLSFCCDDLDLRRSSFCYSCISSSDLYNCKFVNYSERCSDSEYVSYSSQLQKCMFCVGLHNKTFCFLNIQKTKEEYEILMQEMDAKFDFYLEEYKNLLRKINVPLRIISSEWSIWNNIENSKDVIFWYEVEGLTQSKYIFVWYWMDNCMDTSIHNIDCVLDYEAVSWWKLVNSSFNVTWWWCSYLYYSSECVFSSHLFWCIWLRNKQYCIFNKQYSKEDYEIMVWKIIRHMMQPRRDALSARPGETYTERWEFFHPSLSPFGYNETVAQEYYPLECDGINLNSIEQTSPSARSAPWHLSLSGETKQWENNVANTTWSVPPDKEGGRGLWPRTGGLQLYGYHRSTYSSDPKIPEWVKTIDCRQPEWAEDSEQWKQLNQMIVGTHGNASVINQLSWDNANIQPNYDICKQIILCEISWRPFMLQKAEIDFYRKHHIPLPRKHPDIRHEERMKLRPGRTLYLRNCDCCSKEMLSVYDKQVGKLGEVREVGNDKELNLPNSLTSPTQIVYCESCYQKEIYG